MVRQCVSPGEDRPHTVYRFTDQIYKVIQFYSVRGYFGPGDPGTHKHYDKKLDSSISRTRRVILEKALCNDWDWFCTFTISKDKFDRKDLITWRETFTQWMRDQRKKGKPIRYLLVPEQHKDGSWHAHGFLSGVPESDLISFEDLHKQGVKLPRKLWKSNYKNWTAYHEKFGFCSLGKIKNPVAAGFYITKYITKEKDSMVKALGLHSYYATKGLNTATKHVDFYGRDPEIDALLVNKYDFCATGMTHVKHNCDWTFCQEFATIQDLEPLDFTAASDPEYRDPAELEVDEYYEFEQLIIGV